MYPNPHVGVCGCIERRNDLILQVHRVSEVDTEFLW